MSHNQTLPQDHPGRRPLKSRALKIPHEFASWLSQQGVRPNQISLASIFFAALAGLCWWSSTIIQPQYAWIAFVLAAFFIQGRLMCNLLDGLVAVECGKKTPSGELFNDIPDRIADPIILVCAGLTVQFAHLGITLGWLAALLAVMTAYVRTLHASMGAPVDFRGPMAKQHRMAIMTIASLLAAIESLYTQSSLVMLLALIIIVIGCITTLSRRITAAYHYLEEKPHA